MATAPIPSDERVFFFPEAHAFGGGERSYLALIGWLHGQGIPHRVVTYWDRVPLQEFAPFPLVETQLNPGPGARDKVAALKSYFANHASRYQPLIGGIQGSIHASGAGLRGFHSLMLDTPSLVGGSRSLPAAARGKLNDLVLRRGLNSGGRTIVNSEFLRDESRQRWGANADIVRMGGMESEDAFVPRRPTTELRMLSVSRIEASKRIDWMIRSLADLERGERPLSAKVDWHLDIAGKGSQIEALTELARSQGIADRVHFLGFVTDEQVDGLYRNAHVFLMPAVQGYGIPAVESLTRGLPVLLHRESGVSDILRDTPWCVVIEGDERAMTPGLSKIVDSVLRGDHLDAPLPAIPTEADWSREVARLCGWLD